MKRFCLLIVALLCAMPCYAQSVSYFGQLSGGTPATTTSLTNRVRGSNGASFVMVSGPYACSASGIVQSLTVNGINYNNGSNSVVYGAIYADSGGSPGALVGRTANVVLPGNSDDTISTLTLPMQTSVTVVSGSSYWIAEGSSNTWLESAYIANAATSVRAIAITSMVPPSSAGTLSNAIWHAGAGSGAGAGYSLYCAATVYTYSAAATDVWTGTTFIGSTGASATGTLTLASSLVLTSGTIHGTAGTAVLPPAGGVLTASYSSLSGLSGLATAGGSMTVTPSGLLTVSSSVASVNLNSLTAADADVWTGKTYASSSGTSTGTMTTSVGVVLSSGSIHGVQGTATLPPVGGVLSASNSGLSGLSGLAAWGVGGNTSGGSMTITPSGLITAGGLLTVSGSVASIDLSALTATGTRVLSPYTFFGSGGTGAGTYAAPLQNSYLNTAGTYGSGLTGTLTLPTGTDVWTGVTYGVAGNGSTGSITTTASNMLTVLTIHGTQGTYNVTQLSASNVLTGTKWGPALSNTGTLGSTWTATSGTQGLSGFVFGGSNGTTYTGSANAGATVTDTAGDLLSPTLVSITGGTAANTVHVSGGTLTVTGGTVTTGSLSNANLVTGLNLTYGTTAYTGSAVLGYPSVSPNIVVYPNIYTNSSGTNTVGAFHVPVTGDTRYGTIFGTSGGTYGYSSGTLGTSGGTLQGTMPARPAVH